MFCPPGYLLRHVKMQWTPTPAYEGQYSDLPFEDPWWKIVLCVLAVLLLIAAAIAEAVDGTGSVTVGVGPPSTEPGFPVEDCCGVRVGGGGTSVVAAALVAAAAAAATAAGLSDIRDPFRRGQDATPPPVGALTLKEELDVTLEYPETVIPGRPFSVAAAWDYTRITTDGNLTASANDVNQNVHITSSYEITAPEFAYTYVKDGEWTIKARFRDHSGTLFRGSDLFVQCFLVGPGGEWLRLLLQDDGALADELPGNGEYTARHHFSSRASKGLWHYYVIAQDVNHATPDMTPEDAAQIIGGMVLTHQLVITFDEDDCPFVPDGHVMVV